MDINLVKEYLQPGLVILVVFLICIGTFLKTLESIKDKFIPVILWGAGIFITVLWFGVIDGQGITMTVFINGTVQGTFVAAMAVFGNQVFKQLMKKE